MSNATAVKSCTVSMLFRCQACVEHRLDAVDVKFRNGSAVSVVLASQGYPGSYAKGKAIEFDDIPSGVLVAQSFPLKMRLIWP